MQTKPSQIGPELSTAQPQLVFAYFTDVEPSNKKSSFTKCFSFDLGSLKAASENY